jgi:uncharacterized LabA/DUF88 family protein
MVTSVILVDFDNIFLSLFQFDSELAQDFAEEPMRWLQELANTHLMLDRRRWLVARCYMNPGGWVNTGNEQVPRRYFSYFRPHFARAGFEVVDCPAMTKSGKNAADIRIVLDAVDLLAAPVRYDEFIIASADSDFTPLLRRIRAADRHITVISPGLAAPAYVAVADKVIDVDGLGLLIRPAVAVDPADGNAQPSPEVGDVVTADTDALQQSFSDYIAAQYEAATQPIHLANLAVHAGHAVPGARSSNWFGRGFSGAISALGLPGAQVAHNYLWNTDRHKAPSAKPASAHIDISGWPTVAQRLIKTVDLPRVEGATWPDIFSTLAHYAAEHEFSLSEATRWTRDVLADKGVQVGRPALSFVLRGVQLGGASLSDSPPPSAERLAQAFYHAIEGRAALAGVELTEEDEADFARWLGLERPPDPS